MTNGPPYAMTIPWGEIVRTLLKAGPAWLLLAWIIWWATHKADAKMDQLVTVAVAHAEMTTKLQSIMQQHLDQEASYQRMRAQFEWAMIQLAEKTCETQANTPAQAKRCAEIAAQWMLGFTPR